MNLDHFSATVDSIVAGNPRYERDAYLFVRDALEYTTKQQKKRGASLAPVECHVSGQQLLEGVRQYALQEYGPMVLTVFEHWRIRSCEDIGQIVFNLIEAREFGKSDHDTLEDFRRGYDFHEAFVTPYRPRAKARSAKRKAEGKPQKSGRGEATTPGVS